MHAVKAQRGSFMLLSTTRGILLPLICHMQQITH
jgi:hypothetical protein